MESLSELREALRAGGEFKEVELIRNFADMEQSVVKDQ